MNSQMKRRVGLVSLLLGTFFLGMVCGSLGQRAATAQMPGIGKSGVGEVMKGVGGPVGSVTELGSSIVEMQEHVNGLQKNLETLKKIQAALGGGK